MLIQVISIFPGIFDAVNFGILGRAKNKGLWDINIINPRSYADNDLGYIDDRPFGGGVGMVMMPGPICESIKVAKQSYTSYDEAQVPIIYLSAQGKVLDQKLAVELSLKRGMILICGRYEGIDDRILKINNVTEISIGDYILSGGEVPGMVLIDSVVRLLPTVVGNANSIKADSFFKGFLSAPQYTRPYEYQGYKVPDVLVSGDHSKIAEYRVCEALKKTYKIRPDLLDDCSLNPQEYELLNNIKANKI